MFNLKKKDKEKDGVRKEKERPERPEGRMSAAELRKPGWDEHETGVFQPQPELQTGLQEQVGDLEPDTY